MSPKIHGYLLSVLGYLLGVIPAALFGYLAYRVLLGSNEHTTNPYEFSLPGLIELVIGMWVFIIVGTIICPLVTYYLLKPHNKRIAKRTAISMLITFPVFAFAGIRGGGTSLVGYLALLIIVPFLSFAIATSQEDSKTTRKK